MDDEPADRRDWHNSHQVVVAAGAAAFLLLAILVFAVLRMSGDATRSPDVVRPGSSVVISPASTSKTTSSSTSYAPPSAQTTEASTPASAPPADSPNNDAPASEPDTTTMTPTTIFNPYVTTTQPAAGHV